MQSLKSPREKIADKPDFKKKASENIFLIRGIGILLVVIGHVIGKQDSGIRQLYPDDIIVLKQAYDFIYTFHMPLFFIVAGFSFNVFSSKKNGLKTFARSRASRLLIPLLCWAPFYYLVRAATGKVEFHLLGVISSLLSRNFIFWFFPAMFFASILGCIFIKHIRSWRLYGFISVTLLTLSFFLTGNISVWFYYNFFYCLGCFLGIYISENSSNIHLSKGQTTFFGILGVLLIFCIYYVMQNILSVSPSLVKLINGSLSFIVLYVLFDSRSNFLTPISLSPLRKTSEHFFVYLGKLSMSIYLLHVLCGSFTRIFLTKVNIFNLGAQLIIGIIASTLGSIIIHRLLRKNRFFLYSIGAAK